jgi:hypothetical protein
MIPQQRLHHQDIMLREIKYGLINESFLMLYYDIRVVGSILIRDVVVPIHLMIRRLRVVD